MKKEKCFLAKGEVHYLGHIICVGGGIKENPKKVEAMRNWPQPKSVRELKGFLGLIGYYRWFIANYGTIARPLIDLLKKGNFKWQQEASEAFEKLKQAMTKAPVLALPDFDQEFIVEYDASKFGIGVILMQNERPLAFLALHSREKMYTSLPMKKSS